MTESHFSSRLLALLFRFRTKMRINESHEAAKLSASRLMSSSFEGLVINCRGASITLRLDFSASPFPRVEMGDIERLGASDALLFANPRPRFFEGDTEVIKPEFGLQSDLQTQEYVAARRTGAAARAFFRS